MRSVLQGKYWSQYATIAEKGLITPEWDPPQKHDHVDSPLNET